MKSELTPLLVFATVVAVATSILAVGSPSTTSDNLSIVVGHGTTIIEDNRVTTPELKVDNIIPKTDNVIIDNLTVGSIPEHGAEQHENVTRELFLPPDGPTTGVIDRAFAPYNAVVFEDAVTDALDFTLKVPDDFVSFVSVKIVWVVDGAAPTDNMYWKLDATYGTIGEDYGYHTDGPAPGITAPSADMHVNEQEPANPLTLVNLAKGDYLGITVSRYAGNALDTLNADVYILGLLFTYVAEQ